MAKDSSTKLLTYKSNNINFNKLENFKNKHTKYKQQTQKQRKQKISKYLKFFGKKSNDNQTTQQPETTIKYNKKEHKKLKTDIFNKLRQKIIKKFSEDINQIFTDTD